MASLWVRWDSGGGGGRKPVGATASGATTAEASSSLTDGRFPSLPPPAAPSMGARDERLIRLGKGRMSSVGEFTAIDREVCCNAMGKAAMPPNNNRLFVCRPKSDHAVQYTVARGFVSGCVFCP